MCTVLLPPDVSPIAVNKYINININIKRPAGRRHQTYRAVDGGCLRIHPFRPIYRSCWWRSW